MLFDILKLMFSWLPAPLDRIAFGAVCLLLLFALVRLVSKIIDMLPFK